MSSENKAAGRTARPHAVISHSTHAELMRRIRNGDTDAKGALAAFTFLALPDYLYDRIRELAEAVKVEGAEGSLRPQP